MLFFKYFSFLLLFFQPLRCYPRLCAIEGNIGDGHICELINPCNLHPCYPDAICYNMKDDGARDGGYRCECPKGMIGDGISDEGISNALAKSRQANIIFLIKRIGKLFLLLDTIFRLLLSLFY